MREALIDELEDLEFESEGERDDDCDGTQRAVEGEDLVGPPFQILVHFHYILHLQQLRVSYKLEIVAESDSHEANEGVDQRHPGGSHFALESAPSEPDERVLQTHLVRVAVEVETEGLERVGGGKGSQFDILVRLGRIEEEGAKRQGQEDRQDGGGEVGNVADSFHFFETGQRQDDCFREKNGPERRLVEQGGSLREAREHELRQDVFDVNNGSDARAGKANCVEEQGYLSESFSKSLFCKSEVALNLNESLSAQLA